jgi:hypothetical protein
MDSRESGNPWSESGVDYFSWSFYNHRNNTSLARSRSMRHAVSATSNTTGNATDVGPATFAVVMDGVVDHAGVDSM